MYETNPDNKEMGAVLKKAYPPIKEKVSSKEISKGVFVSNLPREQVIEYIKKGKIVVDGVEILPGWIAVNKHFNPELRDRKDIAVGSNLEAAVILDIMKDKELEMMGAGRDIVREIQKLRKDAKLNIDDQIDVFYEVVGCDDLSFIEGVVASQKEFIKTAIKMPFIHAKFRQSHVL